jgi:hypothetical protein
MSFKVRGKILSLSLCLIKYHNSKHIWLVEVLLHTFLNSVLEFNLTPSCFNPAPIGEKVGRTPEGPGRVGKEKNSFTFLEFGPNFSVVQPAS